MVLLVLLIQVVAVGLLVVLTPTQAALEGQEL